MNFCLHIALARIRKNLKQYALFMMQIAIGTAILYIALTMQDNAQTQLDSLKASAKSGIITIKGFAENGAAITKQDLESIEQALSSKEFKLSYEDTYYIFAEVEGAQQKIPVLIVSNNYYNSLMGMSENTAQSAYVGENISQLISNENLNVLDEKEWDASAKTLFGIPLSSFSVLSGNKFAKTSQSLLERTMLNSTQGGHTQEAVIFDNAIIIPASETDFVSPWGGVLYVQAEQNSINQADDFCKKVLNMLSNNNSGAEYYYENPFASFENAYSTVAQNAKLMMLIAYVLFGILMLGFSGLLLLLINKRSASLAISRMCGASTLKLAYELFFEVFIVVGIGFILGIVLATLLLPLQSNLFVPLKNSLAAIAQVAFGITGICFAVSGIGLLKIIRVSPSDALRSL